MNSKMDYLFDTLFSLALLFSGLDFGATTIGILGASTQVEGNPALKIVMESIGIMPAITLAIIASFIAIWICYSFKHAGPKQSLIGLILLAIFFVSHLVGFFIWWQI